MKRSLKIVLLCGIMWSGSVYAAGHALLIGVAKYPYLTQVMPNSKVP